MKMTMSEQYDLATVRDRIARVNADAVTFDITC
jgi:hypothetical protein